MAFVFGSAVKGTATTESDVDIAVYFTPKGKELEWEETQVYHDKEDKIWGDVEHIVGARTDFVVLNRAPATLAATVISEGVPITIKDYAMYLRFFLNISSAAEYFREFTSDFWAIKQRSRSLTDIDRDRLIRIADFLETELNEYPVFTSLNQKIYESDAAMRRNAERWAENIVNSSIDIAKIILASEKKRIPQTYREVLKELSLVDDFKEDIAEKLARFAKLRNILAHEYLDIRFAHIKNFIQESELAYRELLGFVKSFIKNRNREGNGEWGQEPFPYLRILLIKQG